MMEWNENKTRAITGPAYKKNIKFFRSFSVIVDKFDRVVFFFHLLWLCQEWIRYWFARNTWYKIAIRVIHWNECKLPPEIKSIELFPARQCFCLLSFHFSFFHTNEPDFIIITYCSCLWTHCISISNPKTHCRTNK